MNAAAGITLMKQHFAGDNIVDFFSLIDPLKLVILQNAPFCALPGLAGKTIWCRFSHRTSYLNH